MIRTICNSTYNFLAVTYDIGAFCFDTTSKISYIAKEALCNAFGYETAWQRLHGLNERIEHIKQITPLAAIDLADAATIYDDSISEAQKIRVYKKALYFVHGEAPQQVTDEQKQEIRQLLNFEWLERSLEVTTLKNERENLERSCRSVFRIFQEYLLGCEIVKSLRDKWINYCFDKYANHLSAGWRENARQFNHSQQHFENLLNHIRTNPILRINPEHVLALFKLRHDPVSDENFADYQLANQARAILNQSASAIENETYAQTIIVLRNESWELTKGIEWVADRQIRLLYKKWEALKNGLALYCLKRLFFRFINTIVRA